MEIFSINISITIFKVFMSCVLAYRKLIIIPKKSFSHIISGTSRGSQSPHYVEYSVDGVLYPF